MTETEENEPGIALVSADTNAIPFRDAVRVWARVAANSFGGPAGQMAVMHRILVDEKKWISEQRFLHALNYTMLLPGPEAQQLATYVGWLLHGVGGGLVAGGLFILPGFLSILLLSILYAGFQDVSLVQALFFGLKPAVMAVVIEAVIRIGRRALYNRLLIGLAAAAFVGMFFFDVPFPIIVLGAGALGYGLGRWRPRAFRLPEPAGGVRGGDRTGAEAGIADRMAAHTQPSLRRSLRTAAIWLALWFIPVGALALFLGPDDVFTRIGVFFSQTAVVSFGGAYAALAYVAQEAVATYGWLLPGEMLDGLGMAETTPGPLIQVVQFVGFMGAYRMPGDLPPMAAGILGAVLTTWVTFVPCFLWIFLGGPYIERLRGNQALSTALSAITAAVVGVILNLATWFSLNVIFRTVDERFYGPLRLYVPDPGTLEWASLLIAAAAFVALLRFKASLALTLIGAAGAGLVYYLLFVAG